VRVIFLPVERGSRLLEMPLIEVIQYNMFYFYGIYSFQMEAGAFAPSPQNEICAKLGNKLIQL